MRISIFGTGYVGLVTGTCLADVGNHVICVDVDEAKIAALNSGKIPIFEPGLEGKVILNRREQRLEFDTDAARAVTHAKIIFIAVGTPPDEDGSADLRSVLAVARTIGRYLEHSAIIVNKSTVPVGTATRVRRVIGEELARRQRSIDFDVVSNPEFLKEGAAIEDFNRPDRIIIGAEREDSIAILRALYAPFNRNHDRLLVIDTTSAELAKYAANAMLATKISFMNELARLAEQVGADIESIRRGIGSDPRIGWHFIYAGAGYGGSCFPKDVRALAATAREAGFEPEILTAVEAVNKRQKQVLFEKIYRHFDGRLKGRHFALWGLSFKPQTDDLREAPSRTLLEALWEAGASVAAYDPAAAEAIRGIYGEHSGLDLVERPETALTGADALIVITEWNVFRSPDFALIREQLATPLIFDGRNLYDPDYLAGLGFTYYGIGRGRSGAAAGRHQAVTLAP